MDVSVNLPFEGSETDALDHLEERIRRTVESLAAVRAERDAAVAELDGARKAAGAAMVENQKLKQELDSLREERKTVRTRIEKLLGQMDVLSGA